MNRVLAALLLLLGCHSPANTAPECGAVEVPADPSTQAPRPDTSQATFHFAGNRPEQREFVVVHDDGSYDYVERWNFGVPGNEGSQKDAQPGPHVDWDDELQATFGWDWKVDCRMHVDPRDDGSVCCHQHCADGGSEGAAYEAPDTFACMNSSAGGPFDWFLVGLRDGGMSELTACLAD